MFKTTDRKTTRGHATVATHQVMEAHGLLVAEAVVHVPTVDVGSAGGRLAVPQQMEENIILI